MDTFGNFHKYFVNKEGSFWRTIIKKSISPVEYKIDKNSLLKELFNSIQQKIYNPSKPRKYYAINKGNSVVRLIPIFKPEDICVYFYCIKELEKKMAEGRIPGTFGGWSLSGHLRSQEKEEIEYLEESLSFNHTPDGDVFVTTDAFSEYQMESSFNPDAWKINWKEFVNNLYLYATSNDNQFVAEIDIANFYDSIRLDILENKIRGVTDSNKQNQINLLFHFLNHWNKDINLYIKQSIGIPQDEVGDCSRILANFYLQDYDSAMKKICHEYGGEYFRYADDQIIFANTKDDLSEIIYRASIKLMHIGLCINQKKVNVMNRKEFEDFFAFDLFIRLDDKNIKNEKDIEDVIDYYFSNKANMRNEGISVLLRILSVIEKSMKIDHSKLKVVLDEFMKEEFLSSTKLKDWHLEKIYNLTEKKEKSKFLDHLDDASMKIIYSYFHYTLIKFYKKIKYDFEHITKRINYLESSFSLN